MRYYKIESNGIILAIGHGKLGEEITVSEFERIQNAITVCPTAPDGFIYRLKSDITWELIETPSEDEPAAESDYVAALERFGVK